MDVHAAQLPKHLGARGEPARTEIERGGLRKSDGSDLLITTAGATLAFVD